MQRRTLKKFLTSTMIFSVLLAFSPDTSKAYADDRTTINTNTELDGTVNYLEGKLLEFVKKQNASGGKKIPKEIIASLFNGFYSYIDLNVIGTGSKAVIYSDKLVDFISKSLMEGKNINQISHSIVDEYKKGTFSNDIKKDDNNQNNNEQSDQLTFKKNFGGFIATEFEYHKEDDGTLVPLMEINQSRLFFSAEMGSSDANRFYFLGEMNPIPEEVIHQIESLKFDKLVLKSPKVEAKLGENIPFEQLFINVGNIMGSGIDLTLGQFKNPFGIWSDYSSHRNFTLTKNNTLVNGFALKKIDLGAMLNKKFEIPAINSNLDFKVAITHGRLSRTFPLNRSDNDDKKDLVTSLNFNSPFLTLGGSAYLAELSASKRVAYGTNFLIPTKYVSLSGEFVYQQNNDINSTFESVLFDPSAPIIHTMSTSNFSTNAENTEKFAFKQASSIAGYLQFDYHIQDSFAFLNSPAINSIGNNLHIYGLYDYWAYYTDGKIYNKPAIKVFHGLKYNINKNVRWTVVEYGKMFHEGYNLGDLHLSSQLELVF